MAKLEAVLDHDVLLKHWNRGASYSPDNIASLLQREFGTPSGAGVVSAPPSLLTVRGREILALLAAGKTNPQIVQQLIIGMSRLGGDGRL